MKIDKFDDPFSFQFTDHFFKFLNLANVKFRFPKDKK